MRKNTVPKLRDCMRDRTPELEVDPELAARALAPLERMLDLSR
jgi:quinolinate synthase